MGAITHTLRSITPPGLSSWGDVLSDSGSQRVSATAYAELVAGTSTPPALDGYYLAATFDEHGNITVAVDALGVLPLYYAAIGEALVIATSPALIASYPGFRAAMNPEGVAALLLTNGGIGGRTVYKGVRRMRGGNVLLAPATEAPREVEHYRVEMNTDSHDMPASECTLRLHEAIVEACRRHIPEDIPHSVMLSGGSDSRVLIGVADAMGVPINALTYGDEGDQEYQCAKAVAQTLDVEHHRIPHQETALEQLERTLWWEGFICAPTTPLEYFGERIPHSHHWLIAGHMADPIFGGVTTGRAFDKAKREFSFDYYVYRTNTWGVDREVLPSLLRKEVFGDSLQIVLDELREEYMGRADTYLGRTWINNMHTRDRHVMSQVFARYALYNWPRFPQHDRKLIHVAAGMHLAAHSGRVLQKDLLARFYPATARQPLDRNQLDPIPILPGAADLLKAGLGRRVRKLRERIGYPLPESRYYYRTHNFNSPGWRRMRRALEPDRERAYSWFNPEAFNAVAPAPDVTLEVHPPIPRSSGPKMLLGLATWMRVAGIE